MPRYYFHVFNDRTCIDEDGQDLDSLHQAREVAIDSARELVCESVSKGHLNLEHRIDIADEAGALLMSVTFREAFTVVG